jgi:hypothetical protein
MIPVCFSALFQWKIKRWLFALFTGISTYVIIAIPTAIIKNPIFGRDVAVTSWSIPVLILTSILSGLLFATYMKNENFIQEERSAKLGSAGALFSFLAVGCPVCNKIALIALGTTGAMQYFAPVQPYLALFGILFLLYALQKRLVGESMCAVNIK